MESNKKFLILGNINAISYKETFQNIKENKIWLGNNCVRFFLTPQNDFFETARTYWYTNLEHGRRHQFLQLMTMEDNLKYNKKLKLKLKEFESETYLKYDNYDAIEVPFTEAIPSDYDGVMGIPITFLDKYNPDQFEILGLIASAGYDEKIVGIPKINLKKAYPIVCGKKIYARVLIKKK